MRLINGVKGFFRFWYDFIVGDDWTVAALVAGALVLTAILNRAGVVSWWVLPLTVIVAVGNSLRRESRSAAPAQRLQPSQPD
jgi:hypothetical protein